MLEQKARSVHSREAATAPPPLMDPVPDAGRGGWRRRWAARALVAASVGWLCFTLVHVLVSGRAWAWLVVDLMPPVVLVLAPAVLAAVSAVCLRSRRWVVLPSLVALLLGAPSSGLNPVGFVRGGDGPAPAHALRVVSWNTEFWDVGDPPDDFYALLRAQRADVYLLQEYMDWADAPVRVDDLDRLRAEFPGHHVAVVGELVTVSAVPIVASRALPATGSWDWPADFRPKVLRTDLQVAGGVLSVYNAHLPVQVWLDGTGPFDQLFRDRLRTQDAERRSQFQVLADDVAANPNPVLLAGDLNTTPAMGDTRRFPAGLKDAVYANRDLYPTSWMDRGSFPRWWRLDWTLVSPDVRVHRYELRDSDGLSDHSLQYLEITP